MSQTEKIEGINFKDERVSISQMCKSKVELEILYQQWAGHLDGFREDELYIEISRSEIIEIAKSFGIRGDEL